MWISSRATNSVRHRSSSNPAAHSARWIAVSFLCTQATQSLSRRCYCHLRHDGDEGGTACEWSTGGLCAVARQLLLRPSAVILAMMVMKVVKQTPWHIVLIHAITTQDPIRPHHHHREKDEEVYGILCGLYEHCQSFYPNGADGKRFWLPSKRK
jgi:hypothetical protein